jgi:cold shock CspA family protein
MQATAYTYDPATRSGSVLLDDGTPLPFDAEAFDAGGLRLLRPGQRVRIETETETETGTENGAETGTGAEGGRRRITLVTLQTF